MSRKRPRLEADFERAPDQDDQEDDVHELATKLVSDIHAELQLAGTVTLTKEVASELEAKKQQLAELMLQDEYAFNVPASIDSSVVAPAIPCRDLRESDVEAFVAARAAVGPKFVRKPFDKLDPGTRFQIIDVLAAFGLGKLSRQQLESLRKACLDVEMRPRKYKIQKATLVKQMLTQLRATMANPSVPMPASSKLARFSRNFSVPDDFGSMDSVTTAIFTASLRSTKYCIDEPIQAPQDWIVQHFDLDVNLIGAACDMAPQEVRGFAHALAYARLSPRITEYDLGMSTMTRFKAGMEDWPDEYGLEECSDMDEDIEERMERKRQATGQITGSTAFADGKRGLIWATSNLQGRPVLCGFEPRKKEATHVLLPSEADKHILQEWSVSEFPCTTLSERMVASFGSSLNFWTLSDTPTNAVRKPSTLAKLGFSPTSLQSIGDDKLLLGVEEEDAEGGLEPVLTLFDARHQGISGMLVGHVASVNRLERQRLVESDRLVVTSDQMRGAKLWDIRTCAPVLSLSSEYGTNTAFGFNAGGTIFVASGGDDEAVTIWDIRRRGSLYQLSTGNAVVRQVAFHTESQSLLAAVYNSHCKMHGRYGSYDAYSDASDDDSDESESAEESEDSGVAGRPFDINRFLAKMRPSKFPRRAVHRRSFFRSKFSLGTDMQRPFLRYVFSGGTCTMEDECSGSCRDDMSSARTGT